MSTAILPTLVEETRTPLQKVGTIVVDATPRGSKSVFFARGGNTTYIFKNGQSGAFVRGSVPFSDQPAYVTDKTGYIAELKQQIAEGSNSFYQEEKYESIQDADLDPYLEIKQAAAKQAVADYIESQKVRDMGETKSKPILQGIANTSTIASGAAGSSSGASLAGLSSVSSPTK